MSSLEQAKSALLDQLTSSNRSSQFEALSIDRKQQVGSGMRGDKIRTYRFQDDIVKDHNTDKVASVDKVLRGNFDLLW